MEFQTKKFTTSSSGVYSSNVFTFNTQDLGYDTRRFGHHHIHATGLGSGGKYKVEFEPAGSEANFVEAQALLEVTDSVTVTSVYVKTFKVTITPGSGSAPVVYIQSTERGF